MFNTTFDDKIRKSILKETPKNSKGVINSYKYDDEHKYTLGIYFKKILMFNQ
jgi:hypothetical protein